MPSSRDIAKKFYQGPTSGPLSFHASRQNFSGWCPVAPQTPLRSHGALQGSLLGVPHWIPNVGPVTFTPVPFFSLFVLHSNLLTRLSGFSLSVEGGVFQSGAGLGPTMPVPAIGTLDHSLLQEEHKHYSSPITGAAS